MEPSENMYREYLHTPSGKTVQMRPFNMSQDLIQLYSWVHKPHVIPQWRLNLPIRKLIGHFVTASADTHQSLFMLSVDGKEICYAETYYVPHDMLAKYYEASPGDYGLHLLIGPADAIGKGNAAPILCTLTDYLFSYCLAKRVLVEPDHKVKPMTILERKLGFNNLGLVQLSNKVATLYAIDEALFYRINPNKSYELRHQSTKITCDIKKWPLLHLHFPENPTHKDVMNWLEELDIILSISEPFVVLSTHCENYQFSSEAQQSLGRWFKKNKARLATYCLGMVSVTEDQILIKKIMSQAMPNLLPFVCIPVPTISEGYVLAKQMIDRRI